MSVRERWAAVRQQVICVLGLSMVWPSLHNQLLYPVTFSYHKAGAEGPYLYYLLYSLVMLATVLFILFAAGKGPVARRLFTSKGALVAFGVAGSCGISLLVACDFSSPLARWFMGAGIGLSAVFVPVHFVFWSIQLTYASKKRVVFDVVLSYLVFCLITVAKILTGFHGWPLSIAYPLVSSALAVVVLRTPVSSTFAYLATPLSGLPLRLLLPSVVLVYVAVVGRCLLDPADVTYEYPPAHRLVAYVCLLVLCALFVFLYRPRGKLRKNADLLAFFIITFAIMVGLLFAGAGTMQGSSLGNYPIIVGINAMELYIWALVLENAQIRHAGIVQPAVLYLVLVVGATRLVGAFVAGGEDMLSAGQADLPVVAINVGLAFLVMAVVNVATVFMLYKEQLRCSSGAANAPIVQRGAPVPGAAEPVGAARPDEPPAAPARVAFDEEEAALEQLGATFQLSKRQMDTLRLAVRDLSAKQIADELFVAESTVNSHLKAIYRKCDVRSRRELIALVGRFRKNL